MSEQNVRIVLTIAGPRGGVEWFGAVINDVTSSDGYFYLEDIVLDIGAADPRGHCLRSTDGIDPVLLRRVRCIEEKDVGDLRHDSYAYEATRSIESELTVISQHLPWIGFLYSQETRPAGATGAVVRQSFRIDGGASSPLDNH